MARKPLGQILVELGMITQDRLNEVLEKLQSMPGKRLGDLLTELDICSPQQITQALAVQFDLTFMEAQDITCDPEAYQLLSEDYARRKGVIPLYYENGELVVATIDPLDVYALDDVAFVAEVPIEPVLVTPQDLEQLMDRCYSPGSAQTGESPAPAPSQTREAEPSTGTADERRQPGAEEEEVHLDDPDIVNLVNRLIREAVQQRASDIHIEPMEEEVRVRYRLDGVLHPVHTVPGDRQRTLISRIKIMADIDISERRVPQEGRIAFDTEDEDIDLRVSTLPSTNGEKVVLRLLYGSHPFTSLEALGFPKKLETRYREMIHNPYGMVLVTGPTGSGKTTTLVSTVNQLNDPGVNIVTIEDPVEYDIPGVTQVSINRDVGLTFSSGLRAMLRQDPDIILVGEIRDGETATMATRAAMTGHLVFATLHTNTAAGAVTRLVDMEVEPYLVASSVVGVMAQRLVRVLCPQCRRPRSLPEDDPQRQALDLPEGPVTLYEPVGCSSCGGTGYRGRMGLFELLPVDREMRTLIMEGASTDDIQAHAIRQKMKPLMQDGVAKVLDGTTSLEEMLRVAYRIE